MGKWGVEGREERRSEIRWKVPVREPEEEIRSQNRPKEATEVPSEWKK